MSVAGDAETLKAVRNAHDSAYDVLLAAAAYALHDVAVERFQEQGNGDDYCRMRVPELLRDVLESGVDGYGGAVGEGGGVVPLPDSRPRPVRQGHRGRSQMDRGCAAGARWRPPRV